MSVVETASYPEVSLSLDENVRVKKGGKETTVPFPWSLAFHHQSLAFRARLNHAKNEAPEEEAVLERCPYKRGHYDDVTFMTPLTVLSVQ